MIVVKIQTHQREILLVIPPHSTLHFDSNRQEGRKAFERRN